MLRCRELLVHLTAIGCALLSTRLRYWICALLYFFAPSDSGV